MTVEQPQKRQWLNENHKALVDCYVQNEKQCFVTNYLMMNWNIITYLKLKK
jgi:hypothetical protein